MLILVWHRPVAYNKPYPVMVLPAKIDNICLFWALTDHKPWDYPLESSLKSSYSQMRRIWVTAPDTKQSVHLLWTEVKRFCI